MSIDKLIQSDDTIDMTEVPIFDSGRYQVYGLRDEERIASGIYRDTSIPCGFFDARNLSNYIGSFTDENETIWFITEDGIYATYSSEEVVAELKKNGFSKDSRLVLSSLKGVSIADKELMIKWARIYYRNVLEPMLENLDKENIQVNDEIPSVKLDYIPRVCDGHIYVLGIHGEEDIEQHAKAEYGLAGWAIHSRDMSEYRMKYHSLGPAVCFVNEEGVYLAPNNDDIINNLRKKGYKATENMPIPMTFDEEIFLDSSVMEAWVVLCTQLLNEKEETA
jgi:hypothetical protein